MTTKFARDRLTALLGMLGSDHDGEVVNAGRLATTLIRSSGLTWNDVVVGSPKPSAAPQPEAPPKPPPKWREKVAACLILLDRLNPKEVDFLTNLANRTQPPTEKQMAWLEGIAERVLP
jgi:hypothetical protein